MIISGPAEDSHKWYPEFAKLVNRLRRDEHYEVDEKKRTVAINETGIDAVEDWLIHNLYESANTPLISYLNNAIKAKELFKLDRDYVVIEGEVLIVDEHRAHLDRPPLQRRSAPSHRGQGARPDPRRIPDARHDHPAELLPDVREARRDDGTALTEASEFQKIYGLGVVPIPTNMPMIRGDQRDLIYRTEEASSRPSWRMWPSA